MSTHLELLASVHTKLSHKIADGSHHELQDVIHVVDGTTGNIHKALWGFDEPYGNHGGATCRFMFVFRCIWLI